MSNTLPVEDVEEAHEEISTRKWKMKHLHLGHHNENTVYSN